MNNILIYGLKDPIGGVEKIVFEYVSCIVKSNKDITFDFLVFSEDFSLESEIKAIGCNVIYIPSKKNDYANYKKMLSQLFEKKQYSAVWGNYSGLTNIDLLTFAKKNNVPIRIAHSHVAQLYWGHPLIKIIGTVLHIFNKKRLPRFATHYWACSNKAGEYMFPKKVHDKIAVINNAINADVFFPDKSKGEEIRNSLGISKDTVVVGHIARMCAAKNQIFLLKIMREIKKINPLAKLLFVGDGELKQTILDTAKEFDLLEDVIFTGYRADIPDLLRAMDVFVLPSLSEGLGLCVIEAQAIGVPCVTSDIVPRIVDVTDSVRFLSLKESESEWATAILAQTKVAIASPAEKISEHGFEIHAQAKKIYSIFKGE